MTREKLIEAIAAHLDTAEGDKIDALRILAEEVEGVMFRRALEENGWNLARAATALGQLRKTRLQNALIARHPELDAERQRNGPKDRRRNLPT